MSRLKWRRQQLGEQISGVRASVGFASETGLRKQNEDFAGAVCGGEPAQPCGQVVAAIADGIGGARGGRVAAETAVRGFLDGFCSLPQTLEVSCAATQVLGALNGWIYSLSQRDADLTGMGCTFTALVMRARIAHVLHVGDSRAYRLHDDDLVLLTTDHTHTSGAASSGILTRAFGVELKEQLDYTSLPIAPRDRFLLCSDGVHGVLPAPAIAAILRRRAAAEHCAQALVTAALNAGSSDNATALVIDVLSLPD
jgi:serine/threonine protein phosphatase PrpC